MSRFDVLSMRCSACSSDFEAEVYSLVNVGDDPDLKASVMDGTLFVRRCPHCGAANLVRHPVLYHDPSELLMIWLTDGAPASERTAREIFISTPGLEQYTGRLVDSVGDLVEKVKIFDAGLDDAAMEVCKYVTKQELGRDVQLKFVRTDGADNEITMTYPEGGQMQMIAVGFNVYEDCRAILSRNPAMQERTRGLVRIDPAWVAQFFG